MHPCIETLLARRWGLPWSITAPPNSCVGDGGKRRVEDKRKWKMRDDDEEGASRDGERASRRMMPSRPVAQRSPRALPNRDRFQTSLSRACFSVRLRT
eukprot:197234-Pyramimonas_sp.AAC.1